MAVSLYGAVRCFQFERFLAGFGFLAIIPAWFTAQLAVIVVFDNLRNTSREYHLDYAATPVLNIAAAGLIWYAVIHFVRKFGALRSQGEERGSQGDAIGGIGSSLFEPRKIAGVIFVAAGVATMSFFVLSGVLLVVVGISLIMDVRLWRK